MSICNHCNYEKRERCQELNKEKYKSCCFDLDGVICNIDNDNYALRTPIMKTIGRMQMMADNSVTIIIINTGRHINNLLVTKQWLKKYDVQYDHIQFGKPVADVYIDDKGWRFEGWTNELKALLR